MHYFPVIEYKSSDFYVVKATTVILEAINSKFEISFQPDDFFNSHLPSHKRPLVMKVTLGVFYLWNTFFNEFVNDLDLGIVYMLNK